MQNVDFEPSGKLRKKLESWTSSVPEGKKMNKFRAAWAQAAVEYFAQITGSDVPGDALSDLLGDMMHYADKVGLDFDMELLRAEEHYAAEKAEAGE